jgi:alkylated DNA repair dioxygenase AlkB
MVNGEKWMKNAVQVKYTLIPMLNYHKNKRYPISEKPSPNLPNDQSQKCHQRKQTGYEGNQTLVSAA